MSDERKIGCNTDNNYDCMKFSFVIYAKLSSARLGIIVSAIFISISNFAYHKHEIHLLCFLFIEKSHYGNLDQHIARKDCI